MKYGQIAENHSINRFIYYCFEFITLEDERRFVRKFRRLDHRGSQILDTFRELVVGGYLGKNKFRVKNELPIDCKTPDWTIVDDQKHPLCVVEVGNYHIDKWTENSINSNALAGKPYAYAVANDRRLYDVLKYKSSVYETIVEKHGLPYIVALFTTFETDVETAEINRCLTDKSDGIFEGAPHLSGVIRFAEVAGSYTFASFANPNAKRPFTLPGGEFAVTPVLANHGGV